MSVQELRTHFERAKEVLLSRFRADGSCEGRLSSSALATATASVAFTLAARSEARAKHREADARPHHREADARPKQREADAPAHQHETDTRLAQRACAWLCRHQNADGGFGDTPASPSNISTTTLVWAALGLSADADRKTLARATTWLEKATGDLSPSRLVQAIRERYGRDHTFSVPILTTCAIADRLGPSGWRWVPALPFELAALPHEWFHRVGLPMVSYALPALIAIGQVKWSKDPPKNPITRLLRRRAQGRTLEILERIQPPNGGFLEAAPLTSFVTMSLLSMGMGNHPVVARGLSFLAATVRPDGSWPIDTNLETWVTTSAVTTLEASGVSISDAMKSATLQWLLKQQFVEEHPYTHAAPGGFAWTNLPGGVPDADDTPGALLAFASLAKPEERSEPRVLEAARGGVTWLLDLQNRDGGIPTFCRGFGKLPFDRSAPDLTAHTVRAWNVWRPYLPARQQARIDQATTEAIRYLLRTQRAEGCWIPLWFGNQDVPDQTNPIYGTSRVLKGLATLSLGGELREAVHAAARRARTWLCQQQGASGGFACARGIDPTIEETGWALEALAGAGAETREAGPALRDVLVRGAAFLGRATQGGTAFPAAPLGLYFAKLWYDEELYPILATVGGLGAVLDCLGSGLSVHSSAGDTA